MFFTKISITAILRFLLSIFIRPQTKINGYFDLLYKIIMITKLLHKWSLVKYIMSRSVTFTISSKELFSRLVHYTCIMWKCWKLTEWHSLPSFMVLRNQSFFSPFILNIVLYQIGFWFSLKVLFFQTWNLVVISKSHSATEPAKMEFNKVGLPK